MSGHTSLADAVMASLRGGQAAQHLLHDIRTGCSMPDALHDALAAVLALRDDEALRGFCRQVQKSLEGMRA